MSNNKAPKKVLKLSGKMITIPFGEAEEMKSNNLDTSWIITNDLIADEDAKPGTNCNAVGIRGYNTLRETTPQELPRCFRILDDDGNIYYEGKAGRNVDFEPLDDFGEGNAGASTIQYFINGKWETL